MSSGNSINRKLLAMVLSVVILPLLIVSAFSASLTVVPTYSPLFGSPFPATTNSFNRIGTYTNANETITVTFTNETQIQQSLPPLFPTFPHLNLTLVAVVVFVAAAFGLLYNARLSSRRNLEFHPLEEEKRRQKDEIIKALNMTIAKLREGQEYKITVLECYKMICEILEQKSTIEGRSLTAREFKELVSRKLNLNSPYLDQLTGLFEISRYSEKQISKSQADLAIYCMQNLNTDLIESTQEN